MSFSFCGLERLEDDPVDSDSLEVAGLPLRIGAIASRTFSRAWTPALGIVEGVLVDECNGCCGERYDTVLSRAVAGGY